MSERLCCLCVDMGTTTTRVWLVNDGTILVRKNVPSGVRDTAREGSTVTISNALAGLIGAMMEIATEHGISPTVILAAGMITSPLGLMEIVHVPTPVTAAGLNEAAVRIRFAAISELPFFLVPGVKTAGPHVEQEDVMRGEETLCIGLMELGMLAPGDTVLNLGSHWKAIVTDGRGAIRSSLTTLSGELMFAAQANTILASSLPFGRLSSPSVEWVRRGAAEERTSGVSRALFCIRLLHLSDHGLPQERLSFLAGVMISNTMVAVRPLLKTSVVITGDAPIAEACRLYLDDLGISAAICSGPELDQAVVRGLIAIFEGANYSGTDSVKRPRTRNGALGSGEP